MIVHPDFQLDTLIRSMALNAPCRHMLFLGAGSSITSGVPSAGNCIWRWKKEIFLSRNPQIASYFLGDVSLPDVQDRIQRWLDDQGGYPKRGDPSEYSYYAEVCYPSVRDRRKFFERLVLSASPSMGYQLLGTLVDEGHFRWVWTTNFDDLVERGCPADRKRLLRKVGEDSVQRLHVIEADDSGLVQVFLHGDFKYDRLKNTRTELQSLEAGFLSELQARCREYPLVVAGYSGNDANVMAALRAAFHAQGQGALYWLSMRDVPVSDAVLDLIEVARSAGREAHCIAYDGFDQFMYALSTNLLRGSGKSSTIDAIVSAARPRLEPFALVDYHRTSRLLKSNCWPIDVPESLYQFPQGEITWDVLREKTTPMRGRVAAGIHGGQIVAMGTRGDLTRCFGEDAVKGCTPTPVSSREMFWDDGVVLGILKEGLAFALADSPENVLRRGRHWFIIDPATKTRKGVERLPQSVEVVNAVEIALVQRGERLYLSLVPDRMVMDPEGKVPEVGPIKNALLARQWNREYNKELGEWAVGRLKLVPPKSGPGMPSTTTVERIFPKGDETGFRYTIHHGPFFSPIFSRAKVAASPEGGDRFQGLLRFKVFEAEEPKLKFANGRDAHPIRGLLEHRPFDSRSSLNLRGERLRVGVVAPAAMKGGLLRYLSDLTRQHQDVESKAEYLIPYPGFMEAFRIALEVPGADDLTCVTISELPSRPSREMMLKEALEAVTRGIDRLEGAVDVVVIGIPAVWASFDHVEGDLIDLDLHDQIKAYCATRRIRTQLIREGTSAKRHQAEVLWWLSLALFAKSGRSPWVLDSSDTDVAYVGIGHAIDKKVKGAPIVLGCAHVFQASGVGVRFKLGRIQDPIWRHKNVHLSREDALRVGYQTRQLFYESMERLPRRVLVCKRTAFIKDELQGFRAGLEGVDGVDFLTLEYEPSCRFIAPGSDGASPFPVRRGTGVIVDKETFFLYLHGAVERILHAGKTYFQGKTRIPSPIRVRRYGGSSTVEQIASDLLGLSKMDWNSFDLYGQWPAHVATPQKIARIGRLIERFAAENYDYRLFM